LLDRFVFLIPEQQEAQNQLFWSFFDAIAGRYETLIDVRFNLHNIYSLLTKLSSCIGNLQDRLILDFGCGTGLALGPIHEFHAEVIGVDAAATMREIAASRGMRVVSPAELLALPEEFDGVIASYVFHLSLDATAIFAMWSKLKSGGAVVANFHKNLGRDSVSQMFESLGAEPTELDVISDELRHGSYIAFRKR
jgi:predicted TPR repeat methyltransferase